MHCSQSVALKINDVRLQKFGEAMLAVGAADSTLSPAGVKALHGFEVLAVDVGFTEADLAAGPQGDVEVAGINGGGQSVVGVVCEGDGFVEAVELDKRNDGAEDFVAND